MAITFSLSSEGDIIADHHIIAQVLREALPYIDFLKNKILVIKLGGSTLENQRVILQDIIWLRALGANPILVHGGGPYINEWLSKMHIPARFKNGLRVTDATTLEIVRMVLCGQVNQGLVSIAAQMGGKVVGLCGTAGKMIQAHIADPELGFVGEIDTVNPEIVQTLVAQGYIPIIAPLGQGPDGASLNINADLVAAHLAGALDAEKLIFLSNVVGICRADGSLISELSETEARQLIQEGVISGGMIPKVSACLDALVAVPRVHIVDGGEQHVLLRELFTDQGAGTMIVRQTEVQPAPEEEPADILQQQD
ncbi:MAG TPA: acetylglutamate kinase [Ktedonobacteraceae bacterium]|nr:acetylglutamate kinase [Ktedonobacteraceae bacterium]